MDQKAYVMNLWENGPEVFIARVDRTWKVLAIEGKKPDGTVIQVDHKDGTAFTSTTSAREIVQGYGYAVVSFTNIADSSERRTVLYSYNTLNPGDLRSKVIPHIPMPPKADRVKLKYGDNPNRRFEVTDFLAERNLFKPDASLVQSAEEARALRNAVIAARDVLVMMNKSRPRCIPAHQIERLNRWARDWFHIAERMSMDFGGPRTNTPTVIRYRSR